MNAAKFHVLHETWEGDTRSLDVLIYHEYYSPADLKLCFSADGSVVMYARGYSIDEGVFYRMPSDFLLTFVKTSSLWLNRLQAWPERKERDLFEQYQIGMITLNELIDLLTEMQLQQESKAPASEVQP